MRRRASSTTCIRYIDTPTSKTEVTRPTLASDGVRPDTTEDTVALGTTPSLSTQAGGLSLITSVVVPTGV